MRISTGLVHIVLYSFPFLFTTGCGKSSSPTSLWQEDKKSSTSRPTQGGQGKSINMQSENLVLVENLAAIIQDNQNGKLSFVQARGYGEETITVLEERWSALSDNLKSDLAIEIAKRLSPQNLLVKEWLNPELQSDNGLRMSLAFLTWPDVYFTPTYLSELVNKKEGRINDILVALAPLLKQSTYRDRLNEMEDVLVIDEFPSSSNDEHIWWAATQLQKKKEAIVGLSPKLLLDVTQVARRSHLLKIDFVKWIEMARQSDQIQSSQDSVGLWQFESERMKLALELISVDKSLLPLFQSKHVDSPLEESAMKLSDKADKLLGLRVKMATETIDANDNYSNWNEYRRILALILQFAPDKEMKGKKMSEGMSLNSTGEHYLNYGIYSLDQLELKGNTIEFHPFALLEGRGKNLILEFPSAKFFIADLRGNSGNDGLIDLSVDRGSYPIGSAQGIDFRNGDCHHTGTAYVVTPGRAPMQQSSGHTGKNAGELNLQGVKKIAGFLIVNLQGGMGGQGAAGIDAINCVQGEVQVIGQQVGKDEIQYCKTVRHVCVKHEGCEDVVKENTYVLGKSSMTYEYSQIPTGRGGQGGRGGNAGRVIISGVLDFSTDQVRAMVFPGLGGQGGESGKCGLGSGQEQFRGTNGDLGSI